MPIPEARPDRPKVAATVEMGDATARARASLTLAVCCRAMAARRQGPSLKKRFGQHHLIRAEACAPLLEYLRPNGERVLEIGPGGGVLTAELLAAGARVDALEIDLDWGLGLPSRIGDGRLSVIVGDALELDLGRWPGGTLAAGNLPYNVATAIIRGLVRHHAVFPRAAFLVQREVAERLAAAPGSRDYGALTVLVGARARVSWLGRVKPGAFRPPPRVEGAFVGLELMPAPVDANAMGRLTETVHAAFATRRKTLRNALAARWGREGAEGALAAARIAPGRRAEELGLEEFLALAAALASD